MKTLVIIRHAKSSWAEPEMDDFDRPLNEKGLRDAPLMAELLLKKNVTPDLIISSPANRAKTTSQTFAKILSYDKEIDFQEGIYHSGSTFFRNELKNYSDDYDTIFAFGHNPDFTYLVSFFSGQQIGNLPTCGMVCIDFEIESWKNVNDINGKMRFFEYPKKEN